MDWTSGYVADIGYTYGYYGELNPLRVKLAFLKSNLVYPEMGHACELGFGQGMSANLHAAGSLTQWHGTDFNPSQAGFAQELAAVAGAGAQLFDETFADFASRPDLPEFDFIAMHGIWSWISDENRTVIVDFIRRKLKVGGVLYISYNTMPGWSGFAPMRHLMTQHAEVIGSEGKGTVNRVSGALDFAEKLIAADPAYVRANPQLVERFNQVKRQDPHYLAHEYFNRDWHPMHFSTMADWLGPAKMEFACSANFMDHIDLLNLTPAQQTFMNQIPDKMFRESVRDFMTNQQFRRDYWVKGPRQLNAVDQQENLRAHRVMLTVPRSEVSLKATGALGAATMSTDLYGPILDFLSDHTPKTLAQIEQVTKEKGISATNTMEAVFMLTGGGQVATVQDDAVITKAKTAADKLNLHLMRKARGGHQIAYLVSPVTGGGITVGRFPQLFLLAYSQGQQNPVQWADFAWQVLSGQGELIVRNGKPLTSPADNLAELTALAIAFEERLLPIMKALRIV